MTYVLWPDVNRFNSLTQNKLSIQESINMSALKVRSLESLPESDFMSKSNKRAKADVSDDSSDGTGEDKDDRLQKMARAMKTVLEVIYSYFILFSV